MNPEFAYQGEVSRLAFDYGTEFLFVDGAVVRIEGVGKLLVETVEAQDFDPGTPGAAAPLLLSLLRAQVKVTVRENTLIVALADGRTVLEVPPSADHEAWTVTRSDGSLLVCGLQ